MDTTDEVIRSKRTGRRRTTLDNVGPCMLRLAVKELAIREGIENPNALAAATGLPYETCRRVWQGEPSMIGLGTIERLCDVLRVRPGQLFDYEYEPDKLKRNRPSVAKKKAAKGGVKNART
jgi:DNA-binding Xre family transcriptional regulator